MADAPALELRGITKRFGALVANNSVDFELRRGEIHALLGENGAGKSTLMNVLYGLHQPDEGQILLDGEPVTIDSPRRAIGLGIGMVHQHFMLVPVMTVAENLVLGAEPRSGLLLDYKGAAKRVRELSSQFGLAVDPDAKVEDIGVGTQQRVEILRALFRGAKVLVLDEPTAVLTPQEAQDLFVVLRRLTEQGTSVVFISHKLNEVLDIADRVTVLRRGEKIDTVSTEGATERSLAGLMVGREVLLRVEKPEQTLGDPLLTLEHVSAVDDRELPAVDDVSLEVRAGEIVGLAGVDANGQSELIEAIMGLRTPTAGKITAAGKDVTRCGPRDTLAAGVSHIAEDRHRRGLVLEFDLAENLCLREYKTPAFSTRGFLSPSKMVARARKLLQEFDVRGGDPETRAGALSGGNQQKVVIARELTADPKVIIAAQPTRGLDVGAIEFVHRRLVEERDAGKGVLLVSLELEEIRSLSDRVLVIYEGRIVAELPPEASEEDFGVYMTGGGRDERAA
ncbi:nucleoside ABC transporter ATP-binding protein [Solirubrobacter pauli]|uniref:Nucleoside ABC transporter ATP-binding protein n=1 Tax=Solirubrobacter pauli TaxID=166793 RepID=A0A660LHR3_9ACTN|nr:ABC transporter ATP-binding protein [Solirubrobacter pauli]RKQ93805.1 nucleoside ABC transporter ATP-binding protein [Solirubrobacter pauli]